MLIANVLSKVVDFLEIVQVADDTLHLKRTSIVR
jgi:hypothetical protein